MQFTSQEMKLIERLRKQERQWPRARWILLAMAAFIVAIYGYILSKIIGMLESGHSTEDATFMVAFFWPKCLLGFCLAAWFVGLAIRDWHGNVHRMLLLRLLDAQQKEAKRDENVAT